MMDKHMSKLAIHPDRAGKTGLQKVHMQMNSLLYCRKCELIVRMDDNGWVKCATDVVIITSARSTIMYRVLFFQQKSIRAVDGLRTWKTAFKRCRRSWESGSTIFGWALKLREKKAVQGGARRFVLRRVLLGGAALGVEMLSLRLF